MTKTVLCRIPLAMYREIEKLRKDIEKEINYGRRGKKKPITFSKAANEYHKNRNRSYFGGGLL